MKTNYKKQQKTRTTRSYITSNFGTVGAMRKYWKLPEIKNKNEEDQDPKRPEVTASKILREKHFQLRIQYSAKLSTECTGWLKTFTGIQGLKNLLPCILSQETTWGSSPLKQEYKPKTKKIWDPGYRYNSIDRTNLKNDGEWRSQAVNCALVQVIKGLKTQRRTNEYLYFNGLKEYFHSLWRVWVNFMMNTEKTKQMKQKFY